MNLDRAWTRTTAWCHYHATRATDGSLPLADNIAGGIADWIAAGEHIKDKLLRLAAPVGGLLLLLLVTIRPTSTTQWLVLLTLATITIAGARRGPLVAAAALALLLAATVDPRLLAIIIGLWCWRAVRHAELAELPGLLDHAMGDHDQLRLDHAADALNQQAGRHAWTPNKLAARLEALGCPITTPTDKPTKKAKKTEQRHLRAIDLDALLDDLNYPSNSTESAPGADNAAAPHSDPTTAAPDTAVEQLPADPLLVLCGQLVNGTSGTSLTTLTEHVQHLAQDPSITRDRVAAEMEQKGVRSRPKVRTSAGNTRGFHKEDLEVVLGPLSSLPPLGPQQPRSGPVATPLTSDVARTATAVAGGATAPATAATPHSAGHNPDQNGWIEVGPGRWTRAS